jgi:hypothetical protein
VKSYIDRLERKVNKYAEPKQRDELSKSTEPFANAIINSKEMITDATVANVSAVIAAFPDLVSNALDDHYTREVVNAIPGYVKRTMALPGLTAARLPSKVTNGYLKEAVHTYVLGLPQACVALSRVALEQALKEALGRQLSGEFVRFQDLLQEARRWNILDKRTEAIARAVANAGNEVLHEKPIDLDKAYDVLTKVGGLLEHIYSGEGKF